MSSTDAEALMLLAVHTLALGVGAMVFVWMIYLRRRAHRLNQTVGQKHFTPQSFRVRRPVIWLAVRSVDTETVRLTLAGQGKFFVSSRVNGWVVVTGPDLPNPDDDVDACFHFLIALSRELGHVQFFYAEKFSAHHAWARLDEGCVTRAFAWTGETVWHQGAKTLPEIELEMKCPAYGDDFEPVSGAAANVKKIPLLAARWGIDPAALHHGDGIAGESPQLY